jgi:hypothetical protein
MALTSVKNINEIAARSTWYEHASPHPDFESPVNGGGKDYFYYEDISAVMNQSEYDSQSGETLFPEGIAKRYVSVNIKKDGKEIIGHFPVLVAVKKIGNPPTIPKSEQGEPHAESYFIKDEHNVVLSCPPFSRPTGTFIEDLESHLKV